MNGISGISMSKSCCSLRWDPDAFSTDRASSSKQMAEKWARSFPARENGCPPGASLGLEQCCRMRMVIVLAPDVIVLAIDTCDARGSVAVLRDDAVLKAVVHDTDEDYSSWLLPAVQECLEGSGLQMEQVDAYAAAAGPGSFTGVRVGLTSVKAWAEVYGKRIVAVSRLEALAAEASGEAGWAAAFFNAQRGQVFGAIYRRDGRALARSGDEIVIAPGKFVETAAEFAKDENISWVSTDAECIVAEEAWKAREMCGERV